MKIRSYFLLKTLDLVKRTKVLSKYKHFHSTLQWDREKVKNYQLDRLKILLHHAKSTVPYYSKELKSIEINNCHDLSFLRDLPILNRDIIQKNGESLISSKFKIEDLIKGGSSGTTGIPIEYYMDKNGLSSGVGAGYVLWNMSGWQLGQCNVHIWGNQTSVEHWNTFGSRVKNFLVNQQNIASTLINEPDKIKEVVNIIMKSKPTTIDGYASSIYTVAKYLKDNNIKLQTVRQVITTAENLEVFQQQIIESVFAPTGDLYGSGEVLGIAIRPAGDNKFYVLDPHIIVETIDCGILGMKDILLTDLDNYGMPMIRYKVGDMIDELHEPELGAKYPFSWFTKIQGRSSDIILLPNGLKFHPVNIFGGTLFRKFPDITRHKVIWNGAELVFLFEVKGFTKQSELVEALTELLKPYQVKFEIKYTDKILPSSSGKYKYMEFVNKE